MKKYQRILQMFTIKLLLKRFILILTFHLLFNSIGLAAEKVIEKLKLESSSNPVVCYKLGELYLKGESVPQDRKEAFNWFEKGANSGHAPCMYELAVMYQEGTVKPVDLRAFRGHLVPGTLTVI